MLGFDVSEGQLEGFDDFLWRPQFTYSVLYGSSYKLCTMLLNTFYVISSVIGINLDFSSYLHIQVLSNDKNKS